MRAMKLQVGIGAVMLASVASAEPRVKCFEGTETAQIGKLEKTFRAVTRRTMDPSTSEIRQDVWTEKDPSKQRSLVEKVDVKAGTFTVDDSELGAHGTGTLVGKPWEWTHYTMQISAKGFDFAIEGELAGDAIHSLASMSKDKRIVGAVTVSATAFDCAKLDEKRKALTTAK
jgi:hypothetical protein